jgi:hypothetical protein
MKDERNRVQNDNGTFGAQPNFRVRVRVTVVTRSPHPPPLSSSSSCAVATTLFQNQNMSTSNEYLTFYDGPLVWIDCEMTGLDYKTDTILEIAVSAIGF